MRLSWEEEEEEEKKRRKEKSKNPESNEKRFNDPSSRLSALIFIPPLIGLDWTGLDAKCNNNNKNNKKRELMGGTNRTLYICSC